MEKAKNLYVQPMDMNEGGGGNAGGWMVQSGGGIKVWGTILHGMGPAPTQKGQWRARSSTQDPRPRIGFSMGNQTCIVPRPLRGLLC